MNDALLIVTKVETGPYTGHHFFAYNLIGNIVAGGGHPDYASGFDLVNRRLEANGYKIVSPNSVEADFIRERMPTH